MIDFEETEFQLRTEKVQKNMFENNVDAILLCTEPEVRYFTGFRSLFCKVLQGRGLSLFQKMENQ